MYYTKTKNIVSIYVDDELTRAYQLDVNTGVLTGLRNKPVQCMGGTYRKEFVDKYKRAENKSFLLNYILYCFRLNIDLRTENMLFWDKIDNLNDEVVNKCVKRWSLILDDGHIAKYSFNKVVKYIREHPSCSPKEIICAFQMEEIANMIGSDNQLTEEDVKQLARVLTPDNNVRSLTPAELRMYNYYMYTQHFSELGYHAPTLVLDYLIHCRRLGVEPRKNNNPTREFYETQKRFNQLEDALSAKAFAKTYEKHPKAWEFEYGNFVVRIPTTGADLVTEGAKMHHCVGSYVNDVERGSTYICFIRHKNTPDVPYITCQIYNNGTIGQYYLAYDYNISSDEDKEFKEAYQAYLRTIW